MAICMLILSAGKLCAMNSGQVKIKIKDAEQAPADKTQELRVTITKKFEAIKSLINIFRNLPPQERENIAELFLKSIDENMNFLESHMTALDASQTAIQIDLQAKIDLLKQGNGGQASAAPEVDAAPQGDAKCEAAAQAEKQDKSKGDDTPDAAKPGLWTRLYHMPRHKKVSLLLLAIAGGGYMYHKYGKS